MYPHISCNVLTDTEDGNQELFSPQEYLQLIKQIRVGHGNDFSQLLIKYFET